jgi:hypothetical protein
MASRLVLGVVLVVGALAAAQGATGAGPRNVHVSGTYGVTDFGVTTCAPAGASASIVKCTTTGFVSQYEGSLTGSSTASFVQDIDCKTGRTHGHGKETFTGTVASVGSGSLTWGIHFDAELDCSTGALTGFTGTGVVNSGTGALGRLNGQLWFTETTYGGNLH